MLDRGPLEIIIMHPHFTTTVHENIVVLLNCNAGRSSLPVIVYVHSYIKVRWQPGCKGHCTWNWLRLLFLWWLIDAGFCTEMKWMITMREITSYFVKFGICTKASICVIWVIHIAMWLLWIVGYISLAGYPGAIPGVSTFVLSRCTVVLPVVLSHPDMVDIQVIVPVWGCGEFSGSNPCCCCCWSKNLFIPTPNGDANGNLSCFRGIEKGLGTLIPCVPGTSSQLPCVSVYT